MKKGHGRAETLKLLRFSEAVVSFPYTVLQLSSRFVLPLALKHITKKKII